VSIPSAERETLHVMLDALLNARESLERLNPERLERGMQFRYAWSNPRHDLFLLASRLMRRAIGPRLHQEEMRQLFNSELEVDAPHAEVLVTVANSIRSFLPLFMKAGSCEWRNDDEVISRIIEDFMGIYWGDEPRYFSIQTRRQGQHKRLYRLNKLRLSALDWDKYLAIVGVQTRERRRLISDAYKTDWDAIRKWARAIEDQYGFRSWPPRDPEWARREYAEDPEKVHNAIRQNGEAYWLEKSAAGSGKDT
jgi:hypothetical protein